MFFAFIFRCTSGSSLFVAAIKTSPRRGCQKGVIGVVLSSRTSLRLPAWIHWLWLRSECSFSGTLAGIRCYSVCCKSTEVQLGMSSYRCYSRERLRNAKGMMVNHGVQTLQVVFFLLFLT